MHDDFINYYDRMYLFNLWFYFKVESEQVFSFVPSTHNTLGTFISMNKFYTCMGYCPFFSGNEPLVADIYEATMVYVAPSTIIGKPNMRIFICNWIFWYTGFMKTVPSVYIYSSDEIYLSIPHYKGSWGNCFQEIHGNLNRHESKHKIYFQLFIHFHSPPSTGHRHWSSWSLLHYLVNIIPGSFILNANSPSKLKEKLKLVLSKKIK